MKTPVSIGLPEKFERWRKGQDRVLKDLLYSEDRFVMLTTPTGSGKSLTYMGQGMLERDRRTCVLTATRSLQDQLLGDFESVGLVDMRGRQNYPCLIAPQVTAADGICTAGMACEFAGKTPGCEYYDQARTALASRLVVTNYAFWLHDQVTGRIGEFPILVLDEAHTAPDQLADYVAVEVNERQLKEVGLGIPKRRGESLAEWAADSVLSLQKKLEMKPEPSLRRKMMRMQTDLVRLARLSEHQWVEQVTDIGGEGKSKTKKWRWDIVDPGVLAEDYLFRGAKKIVLASASVRRKTLDLLGVSQRVKVIEQDSVFPVKRRPVYFWPLANVSRKMKAEGRRTWIEGMDEFIDGRLDRKGIIHSVSYDRAWEIAKSSRHWRSGVFVVDSRRRSTQELVEEYRKARPPKILVSPAVGTGLDFPYETCEYQIIAKVPFPDISSPLIRARQELDKSYGSYVALQQIVQQTGRGMRAEDDQCETVICDSNFGWLRRAHWDFAPRWWHRSVRTVGKDDGAPEPLEKL